MGIQKDRVGQVVIVAAFALVVLVCVAALTVDVGYMFCAKARLQNAADAAALAAAQELAGALNTGATEEEARSAAAAEGQTFVVANWQAAGWQVAFGTLESGQFVPQDLDTPATAVLVTTRRDASSPGGPLAMFFAPVLGLDAVDVDAAAVCQIARGISTVRGNLAPFTVAETQLGGLTGGDLLNIYPETAHTKYTPGNFGLVDLNGGSLGTPETADWIRYGYDGEVTVDPVDGLWIGGEPGLRAGLEDDILSRVGETMLIMVHDEVVNQGSVTEYHITQFAAVTIVAADLSGSDKYVTARFERLIPIADAEHGGGLNDNLCKIQLVL